MGMPGAVRRLGQNRLQRTRRVLRDAPLGYVASLLRVCEKIPCYSSLSPRGPQPTEVVPWGRPGPTPLATRALRKFWQHIAIAGKFLSGGGLGPDPSPARRQINC